MKSTLEKQLKKNSIVKKENLGKAGKKEKLFKYEIESLKEKASLKVIEKAKEKLGKENQRKKKEIELKKLSSLNLKSFEKKVKNEIEKEKEKLEKKSKLESFEIYGKQNLFTSQFAFNEKDFFIHGIELNENEKEKNLFYIYNQIESIGKGFQLNEIEKIILENLKKDLIFKLCENFENLIKGRNKKDLKKLSMFFQNSHLKQYIKNSKEKESLNIFESEKLNIYGKAGNNFESKIIEKVNGKFVLKEIEKLEKKKALESLKNHRKYKKMNEKEKENFLKKENKVALLKERFERKDFLSSEYNLKSKQIENSINGNSFLIKTSKQIERMKRKVFERNGIDLKEKQLKKEIESFEKLFNEIESNEKEITGIEKLKALESYEKAKKSLKDLKEKKKEIELKIFGIYKEKIEKIINHGKAMKENELKVYKKEIANLNISKVIESLKFEYSDYFKESVK